MKKGNTMDDWKHIDHGDIDIYGKTKPSKDDSGTNTLFVVLAIIALVAALPWLYPLIRLTILVLSVGAKYGMLEAVGVYLAGLVLSAICTAGIMFFLVLFFRFQEMSEKLMSVIVPGISLIPYLWLTYYFALLVAETYLH
jgi:hypothetical protein